MKANFWLGAACGVLVTAAAVLCVQHPSPPVADRPLPAPEAQGRLATAERELARTRAEAARELAEARAQLDALNARLLAQARQPASSPSAEARREDPGVLAKVPEVGELIAQGDCDRAASVLAADFADGTLTKLELMQLAVRYPEVLVAGVNDFCLPDAFRMALVDTLSSLRDPFDTIAKLNLEKEPNQRMSSRIAGVVAQTVERSTAGDARVVPVIQKLLAGNQMIGEKVNLYPVLAQLGAQGDPNAQALLRDANVGIFSPGIKTLLDPPVRDEQGKDLAGGAVIYSVQYNKGQWGNRPAQLRGGDTIVGIGDESVGSAAEFFNLLKKHHGLGANDFIDAKVVRPSADVPGRYEYASVKLDPGDLQLLYGVYSVKRR